MTYLFFSLELSFWGRCLFSITPTGPVIQPRVLNVLWCVIYYLTTHLSQFDFRREVVSAFCVLFSYAWNKSGVFWGCCWGCCWGSSRMFFSLMTRILFIPGGNKKAVFAACSKEAGFVVLAHCGTPLRSYPRRFSTWTLSGRKVGQCFTPSPAGRLRP